MNLKDLRYYWVLSFTCLCSWSFGQTFTEAVSLPIDNRVHPIHFDWGDYDNDRDLDVLVTGVYLANNNSFTRVYRNDNGNLVDIKANIEPSRDEVEWGDYDGDGELDILLSGKIYRNQQGNFTELKTGLAGSMSGGASWGDFDGDGDLDVLTFGGKSFYSVTATLYRNENGTFQRVSSEVNQAYNVGSAAWGDYDGDGDLDLIVSGSDAFSTSFTRLYQNTAGSLKEVSTNLPPFSESSVAWGDYDSDGDLDLAITGLVGSSYASKIFRNDGGVFVDLEAGLVGVSYGNLAWGDYDNDGDLDVLLTGLDHQEKSVRLYRNEGGRFVDSLEKLPDNLIGQIAWGDYDNDGDLDILASRPSYDYGLSYLKILKNTSTTLNTPPTAPTNLRASVQDQRVTLQWDAATDDHTPSKGLSYNLYVRKGADTVMASHSASDGLRKIVRTGQALGNASWVLREIVDTVYHFGVQAIDASFKGSPFSTEFSFVPPATLLPSNVIKENMPVGALVGELTSEKVEATGFSYQFASGEGDTDNSKFTIDGTRLKTNQLFDYESQSVFSLRLKIYRQNQVIVEKIIRVKVEDIKEPPSDIYLSRQRILPNSPAGTVVGKLTAGNQDAADTHIFTLVDGSGGKDNSFFTIRQNELRTAGPLESGKSQYNIRLRVEDGQEGSYDKSFTVEAVDGIREAEKRILSVDGQSGDQFGHDVAIDGNYAIVGAPGVDNAQNNDAGAAYIYQRTVNGWVFQQKLTDSLASYIDYFGHAVAISGDFAVVGAYDGNMVYIYQREGNGWNLHSKLQGKYFRTRYFGYSVDIEGDQLIIGEVNGFGDGPTPFGNAYVYQLVDGQWTETATLSPSDGFERQRFGYKVAISGDMAVVSSHCEAATENFGRSDTYVFKRAGSAWMQLQKIKPADAESTEFFIGGIDLSNDYVVVGTPGSDSGAGAALVYQRTETSLEQLVKLTTPDSSGYGFGQSVAIQGNRIVVGAPGAYAQKPFSGAAFLFSKVDGQWVRQKKFFAGGASESYGFGGAVALSDEFFLAGVNDDRTIGSLGGAAYLYDLTSLPVKQKNLPPTDLRISQSEVKENQLPLTAVGRLTTIDSDAGEAHTYEVIGVDNTSDSRLFIVRHDTLFTGQALDYEVQSRYLVRIRTKDQTGGTFEKVLAIRLINLADDPGEKKLTAQEGESYEFLGGAVALSDTYGLIGASRSSGKVVLSGAAYVYKRNGSDWSQVGKISPEDGEFGGGFGWAVAITSDYAAISAVGGNSASVYLFVRKGESWVQQAKVAAPVPSFGFGKSISLLGDTLVVGDPDVDNGRGVTYVYARSNDSWTLQATLSADGGASYDGFGTSVSLSGNYLFIGSSGGKGVYVYERSQDTWKKPILLTSPGGQPYEYFGTLVSVSGKHAVVSSRYGSRVYAFELVDGQWVFQSTLLPKKWDYNDGYGNSLVLSGNYAAVGAPGDSDKGAVYLFRKEADGWKEYLKLKASDGDQNDNFGGKVALFGNWVMAGATGDDDKANEAGAAYLFNLEEVGTPTNLRVKEQAATFVTLQWSGTAVGPTGYLVERSPVNERNFVVLDSTETFQYRDSTVNAPSTYTYRVRAYQTAFLSQYSNEIRVAIKDEYVLTGRVVTSEGQPVTSGIVTLYRKDQKDSTIVVSTYLLAGSNAYSFPGLPPERYTLRAAPDTAFFPGYSTTYYGDQLSLSTASWIVVGPKVSVEDIRLIATPVVGKGKGIIKGILVRKKDSGGGRVTRGWQTDGIPIGHVQVYLVKATGGQPVAQATTDNEGFFSFSSLLPAAYTLLVDYSDTPMDPANLSFELTDADDTLRITASVDENHIRVTKNLLVTGPEEEMTSQLSVFPNPVQDILTIEMNNLPSKDVQIKLFNSRGETMRQEVVLTNASTWRYHLDFRNFSAGLYLLEIRLGHQVLTRKILKP